jgi:MFS family permease
VLGIAEPASAVERAKQPPVPLKDILAAILKRDAATRLVFLNKVAWGIAGLVMVWTNQKYWEVSHVPLPWFGALYAGYNLVAGFGGRLAAVGVARWGRRATLAAVGALPVVGYFGMAAFPGWGGIALGVPIRVSGGMADVLFLSALNERIASGMRATVLSMASLAVRASFSLLGPVVGYGIDGWGLSPVLAAIGAVYAIAFTVLLLPLILRDGALAPTRSAEGARSALFRPPAGSRRRDRSGAPISHR